MSVLEDQITEYFTVLVTRVEMGARIPQSVTTRATRRGSRRRRWLAAAAAAVLSVVTLVFAFVLVRSDDSSPRRITTPATDNTSAPTSPEPFTQTPASPWPTLPSISDNVDSCWPAVGPGYPVLWLAVWEEGQGRCLLAAEDQRLKLVNKGDTTITLDLGGMLHEIPSEDEYTTGRIGDALGPGAHAIPVTPFAPILLEVRPASASSLATLTFDSVSLGPFRLGGRLDELASTNPLRLVWDGDPTLFAVCRAVFVQGDPYTPRLTIAQDRSGVAVIASIAVWSPQQRGPGGIATGMSRAQLEAATGSSWQETDIRRRDDLGDQFLVWEDKEHGTEIVAALTGDVTQEFVIRYTHNSLRNLDVDASPAGECSLS